MNFNTNTSAAPGTGNTFNFTSGSTFGAQPVSNTSAAATTINNPPLLPSFATATSSAAPTLNFSLGAPKTTPGIVSFGQQPASIASEPNKNVAPTATLTSTTTTTPSANATNQLNFCQVEEHINKWTSELEEQAKMFMNQATQVNSWDKVLINNNNKIIALSESVEKVKIEQQALEHELEFISAQHTELDECITPLQTELSKIQHLDVEKAQAYILAENLDTQLRQMSEDLKEVIEHLNEANKVQDTSDPIVQIGLILNAHMSSLQWIETSASKITTKLDDISTMCDTMRRNKERSYRLTYND